MTDATPTRAPVRWRLPHPTLVWAIAAAWAVAVAAQVTGQSQALHHDGLAGGGLAPWAALGLFLLAWQLMIAAMMLPSSLPLVRLFDRVNANQPKPLRAKAAFLGGYAALWTGFGMAASLATWGSISWLTAGAGWPPGLGCSAARFCCWPERSSFRR
jgi:predicted metal-binding membrane protein